jgi:eukaryotic-like serine/threonine-protein kinase
MHAVMGGGRLIAGRYRLQGPIGRGAMGIVWRGRDELLDRDVAVKEVQITAQAAPADAEAIYQRTLREARTAARLSHPSVVTVFDVVEENGSPWIVMELVDARSLDRVISEDGPLPPLQAAELGACLVGALATAHAAGVLHRDVKPSNVLVTDDGKAVLTDFGIATFSEDPSQTLVGMVVGTPGFTAPERVRGNGATPASDLWSLGATLYAAVEGRGPFDRVGGSAAVIAGVATEAAPRSPSAGPLAPVIDALLSRDPGTRPDATTAARLLTEAATAARTGARPLGDGWLAAEASTAERDAVSDIGADPVPGSAHAAEASSDEQRAAFLDPPVFGELSIPDWTGPADALEESLGSRSLDETPLVAAGQFADVGLGAGIGLGAGAGIDLAPAGAGFGLAAPDPALASAAVASAAPASDGSTGDPTQGTVSAGASAGGAAPHNAGASAWAGLPGLGLAPGAAGAVDALATAGLAGSGSAGPALAGPALAGPSLADTSAADAAQAAGPAGADTLGLAGPQLGYGGDGNPVLWEPLKPTPGGSGAGGSPGDSGVAPGSGGSGSGGNGRGTFFWRRGGPAKPSSGRWRLMVAGAGIAAIAVAAVIGWDIYSHTQAPQALQGPNAPSITGSAGGSGGPGSSGSPGGQHRPGTTPTAGGSAPPTGSHSQTPGKGKPSSGPSGKPSSSPSSSASTSPSPSPTPSSTPTPSPSPSSSGSTPPVLPTGYVWHHFTAAVMGSTAGFKIGMPSPWRQSVIDPIAHLNQPVHDFHLMVNLARWTYVKPLAQAQYLEAKDAKNYNGFKELSLGAVNFTAIGGFKVAPAAELKFTWTKPLAGSYTELVILVTLTTKSGVQPYTLTVWAPTATFASAHDVFHKALMTFRPLPAT